jgi:polyhydroxybutyrate depolymerase
MRYYVRTPSNYDATVAHPLLMVYAAAGQSGLASERLTGLTPPATAAGFVVVYADHQPLGIRAIEQLGTIPGSVAKTWCIDEKRVYLTGHSNGGTIATAMAVLDRTKHLPAAIAPSAAGVRDKDLAAYQCPASIPVMIMHGAKDTLFPGWGAQTAAWWAACNHCDVTKSKPVEGGCLAYQHCESGAPTLYCEGSGGHRDWPALNHLMLEFFARPENFL